jgi:hypothetical protein
MLEQVASFSELIGAIGVILSLVYVGRQLRQAGAQTVHDNFSGWYSSVQGDPDLWRCWEYISMNFLATPGGKGFWDERGYMFSDKYRGHVESVILRQPHPSAKPWGAFDIGR